MKTRVAIINSQFLNTTEIWIRRHIEGLKNYYPIVIVKYRVDDTQPQLKQGKLFLFDSWRLFTKPLNIIAHFILNLPFLGYEIFLKIIISFYRIQLVHIHFFWNAIWFFDYVRHFNIPIIVTAHGTDVNFAFANPEYRDRITNIFQKVNKVICVSHFIKNKLIELGCPKDKLVVNYLGVPIVSDPHRRDVNDSGNIRLICVAAFRPEKGHEMLLDVFSAVLAEYPSCELCLVGDGELREALQAKVNALCIADKVLFCGWKRQENVFQLLSESDIYVQCSKKYFVEGEACKEEGMPISPLEAAMIGLPLVLTDVGGVGEVCIDGINGFLCPYGDVSLMKERIFELIHSSSLRNQFANNSAHLVRSKFDQERNIESLESIYSTVMQSK
jgi:colanic acid/amylovoran biosynthesis glycosyltransferase